MYEFHPDFETPESSTQLWRYMDFVSLVWILQNSALWFSRADYFEDKWEGAYPIPSINALKAEVREVAHGVFLSDWESFSPGIAQLKKTIFINCWYANDYESAAMWQIYAGAGNSIALRSTIGSLINSLREDKKKIHIGKIKYIDYEKDFLRGDSLFVPYLRKRKSFAHESEVRLIMWSLEAENSDSEDVNSLIENALPGHAIKVNLDQMIDRIFISPKAKPWFLDLVRDVLKTYNCEKIKVEQSDFDVSPPI